MQSFKAKLSSLHSSASLTGKKSNAHRCKELASGNGFVLNVWLMQTDSALGGGGDGSSGMLWWNDGWFSISNLHEVTMLFCKMSYTIIYLKRIPSGEVTISQKTSLLSNMHLSNAGTLFFSFFFL